MVMERLLPRLVLDTMCTKVMLPYCYVDEAAAYDGYDDYSIKGINALYKQQGLYIGKNYAKRLTPIGNRSAIAGI